jgi:A1 cistron-splicing factor AAR2
MNSENPITPAEALELYPKTGILILLNLPKTLRIGLDNTSFQISEKFKGFKLIPPGCHYLHYTDHCTEGEFFWIEEGEVIVKQWTDYAENGLSWASCGDKEKEERLALAAKNMELDPFLGAYQYQ